ncbi:hypothetical protein ACFPT7_20610 [Acidicapsa dinghuensis]|uniref:Uncharacterized protein n=1 Tax=Acidicapsa dinghuensis TaxID=2218256 RepID=A0ABW1EKX2_9BACT|nr:hypothetical protein [Acidicapsa dinghuensis]
MQISRSRSFGLARMARKTVPPLLLAMCFTGICVAQEKDSKGTQSPKPQQVPQPAQTASSTTPPQPGQPPANPQTSEQKQLADDTARLLQLANELKTEMDKSTKDTLSLSVVKKADEIEKLARKVRAEMKAALGD